MKWLKFLKVGGITLAATGVGLFLGGRMGAVETAAPTSAYQSPAISPGTARRAVRVRMRDGVELAGDLYLPDGAGPFPTLVRKTPYNREGRANDERIGTVHFYAAKLVWITGANHSFLPEGPKAAEDDQREQTTNVQETWIRERFAV